LVETATPFPTVKFSKNLLKKCNKTQNKGNPLAISPEPESLDPPPSPRDISKNFS
jgi:hypothetical protein